MSARSFRTLVVVGVIALALAGLEMLAPASRSTLPGPGLPVRDPDRASPAPPSASVGSAAATAPIVRPGAVAPTVPAGSAATRIVPVLMYHRIGDPAPGARLPGLSVRTRDFAAQLALLKSKGWSAITAGQLGAAMAAGTPVPPRTFVISFDDGRIDNWTTAFPILRLDGFKATFFIPAGLTEQRSRIDYRELAAMARAGDEIANHSMTHRDLGGAGVTASVLASEITAAGQRIQAALAAYGVLTTVTTFAYPYGTVTRAAEALLARDGYTLAVTTVYAKARIGSTDPLRTPRLRVWRGETAPELLAAMTR